MIGMSTHLLLRLAVSTRTEVRAWTRRRAERYVAGSVRRAARYAYHGRHRAAGASTSRLAMESASYLASLVVPPEVVPVAEVPIVAPQLGAGRYAHLRTDELDSTAERMLLLNELGIAPPRTAWLDEWAVDELVGAAT